MLSVDTTNSRRRKAKTLTADIRRPSRDISREASLKNTENVLLDNFQHIIYEKAAIIYGYLEGEENPELPKFQDEAIKRRAYSLAFGAKKCEQIVERNVNFPLPMSVLRVLKCK